MLDGGAMFERVALFASLVHGWNKTPKRLKDLPLLNVKWNNHKLNENAFTAGRHYARSERVD